MTGLDRVTIIEGSVPCRQTRRAISRLDAPARVAFPTRLDPRVDHANPDVHGSSGLDCALLTLVAGALARARPAEPHRVSARGGSSSSRRTSGRSSPSRACAATATRSSRRACGSTRGRRCSKGGRTARRSSRATPTKSLLDPGGPPDHEDIKMPPKAKLPEPAVEALDAWVKMGAPWPDTADRRRRETRRTIAADALGVPARPGRSRPRRSRMRAWVDHAGRCLHPREARSARDGAVAPRRQADLDPPRHVRPDRPAADGRGDRGVRGRPDPRRLRPGRRPPARLAPLRRALGAALARRRPLRRHQGLRLQGGATLSRTRTPTATT